MLPENMSKCDHNERCESLGCVYSVNVSTVLLEANMPLWLVGKECYTSFNETMYVCFN